MIFGEGIVISAYLFMEDTILNYCPDFGGPLYFNADNDDTAHTGKHKIKIIDKCWNF